MKFNFNFLHERLDILLILFLSTLFGQFAGLSYLPILPAIQYGLHVKSHHVVQLALTFYLSGFLIPQLFAAHISDIVGRRKVFLIGLSLATIAIFCASLSPYIILLFIFLFGTASGIGLVTSINNAIVRDTFSEDQATHIYGLITFALTIGGIIAPIFSGFIGVYFGWRWVFLLLGVVGAVILVIGFLKLTETFYPEKVPFSLRSLFHTGLNLFKHRRYFVSTLNIAFPTAALTAFNGTVPFLFHFTLGFSAKETGIFMIFPSIFMVFGVFFASTFVHLLKDKILLMGNAIMIIASGCLLLLGLDSWISIFSIIIPVCLFSIGLGMITPYAWAQALASFSDIAAVAAAFVVFTQNLVAICISLLIVYFPEHSELPLGSTMLVLAILGVLGYLMPKRPS